MRETAPYDGNRAFKPRPFRVRPHETDYGSIGTERFCFGRKMATKRKELRTSGFEVMEKHRSVLRSSHIDLFGSFEF